MTHQPPLSPVWRRRVIGTAAATLIAFAIGWVAGAPPSQPVSRIQSATRQLVPGRAHAWLAELQRRYPERRRGSKALRESAPFIRDALRSAGAQDVRLQHLKQGARRLVNILGRIPGRDRNQTVVLAAHYDVVPGAPGAIDDGGAIAAILEAVRALSAGPPPSHDILIAIYDGEEEGLVGSKAHLASMTQSKRAQIRAAMAVELVGWTEDKLVVHTIPYGFAWDAQGIAPEWLPAAVRRSAALAGVPVGLGDPYISPWYQGTVRLMGVKTGSDAGAFLEAGIPSCMLTGSALTNFYSGYHTHEDGMAQVSSEQLDRAALAISGAALGMTETPTAQATAQLGGTYLMLGNRTLHRPALTIVGLLAALSVLLAAIGFGRPVASTLLLLLAVVLAGLAIVGGVAGLVVGAPLGVAVALATCLVRRVRWVLYPGFASLFAQVALLVSAILSFGFRMRGSQVEWALSLALLLFGPAAAVAAADRRPQDNDSPPDNASAGSHA